MTINKVFVLFSILLASACGKPDPVNETHAGELTDSDQTLSTDNSKYDEYSFRAAEGDTIRLTMSSDAVDSYVHLINREGDQIAQDDDSGGGKNARLEFRAPYTGEYKALANTYDATGRGAYSLQIQTTRSN